MIKKILVLITLATSLIACNQVNESNEKVDTFGIEQNSNASRAAVKSENQLDIPEKKNESVINSASLEAPDMYVRASDSIVNITSNIRIDYRVFFYQQPDTASKKMLVISVFDEDVVGNPFECPIGAYFGTEGMEDWQLKYMDHKNRYYKIEALNKVTNQKFTLFLPEKAVEMNEG